MVVKSIADAIALSDLILLAIPYEAAKQTLAEAGDLSGKIVIIVPIRSEKASS